MGAEERLARFLLESRPAEASRVLEGLSEAEAADVLRGAEEATAVGVLEQMDAGAAASALLASPEETAQGLLAALPADAAARVLRRLDPPRRARLSASLPPEHARRVRRALEGAEGSTARLMDPNVPTFPEDLQAGRARHRMRRRPNDLLFYLYLTDARQRLSGVLSLRELMLAPARRRLDALAHRPVQRLHVRDDRTAILAHPGWRTLPVLPVVDEDEVPVGVLRYATLRALESSRGVERAGDLLLLGDTLGRAWMAMAATLLDGFAASLAASRERS